MFIFSYFYCPNFNVKILEVSTHACSYQLNTLVQLIIIFLINPGSHHLIQIKKPKHQMMMVLVMPQGKVMVREHDGDITDNYDEPGQGYEDMEQENDTGIYSNGLHYENGEDFDDFNYDNGDDEY